MPRDFRAPERRQGESDTSYVRRLIGALLSWLDEPSEERPIVCRYVAREPAPVREFFFHLSDPEAKTARERMAQRDEAARAAKAEHHERAEQQAMLDEKARLAQAQAQEDAPKPFGGVSKADVLHKALDAVADRGLSYGAPEDNFVRIARYWNAHLKNRYGSDLELDAIDVALMCGQIKDARIDNMPTHADSWVDKAGYAACGGAIASLMEKPLTPIK